MDCVSASNRAVAPRATFGEGRVSGRPVVTLAIISLCAVAFMGELTIPGFMDQFQFEPLLGVDEPWRFVTAAFLHANVLHIAFNMFALWMVGPFLETSLGRARYITLYLLAALSGSVAMVVAAWVTSPVIHDDVASGWMVGVVGASGAVFGLFGAVLVVLKRTGRSAQGIIGVLVINGILGFVIQGIAWQAHLGGLLAGAALGAAYAYAPRKHRLEISVAASLAVALILVGVVVGVYLKVGLMA